MIKFYKMHGIGNDYIYFDCFSEKVENPKEMAVLLSDRHFGIGGDGIVLIKPSKVADCMMDMYNADGSQGKMCGNAIRCVAKFLHDNKMTDKDLVTIETLSGIKTIKLNFESGLLKDMTVNMGRPILIPIQIPVNWSRSLVNHENYIISETINADGQDFEITCVSMGNPHAIVFVDSVDNAPVEKIGKIIENMPIFPDRINVEFVEVIDDETVKMRVWERGSGETLACGTGACATLVACVLNGKTKRNAKVCLTGGELLINWNEETDDVFMTGPAKFAFYGFVDMADYK